MTAAAKSQYFVEPHLRELYRLLKVISEEELAELGGVDVLTVKAWRHRKTGIGKHARKIGKSYVYEVRDVAQEITDTDDGEIL